jgi:hypothetical protein
MTKKVFALDTQPGIQRDGTVFDRSVYTMVNGLDFNAVVLEKY